MTSIALAITLASLMATAGSAGAQPRSASAVTWRVRFSAPPTTPLYGLSCPSKKMCVAVGGGSVESLTPETTTGTIYRTDDGGFSWVRENVTKSAGSLQLVSCGSTTTCVAAGWNPTWSAFTFLVSHDGGVKWSAFPHNASQPRLNSLECAGSVCNGVGIGDAPYVRSTDDGDHWSETPASSSADLRFGLGGAEGLACPSASICYVTGVNGIVKVTSGGLTASLVAPIPAFDSYASILSSISCRNANVCTAAGLGSTGQTVAWTADGGRSWVSTTLPSSVGAAVDVSCTSTLACTLVALSSATSAAPDLVAVSTTDRGAVWTVRPLGVLATAGDYPWPGLDGGIACTFGPCVAAGFGTPPSSILVSRSTGSAWAAHPIGGGGLPTLNSATCVTAALCLAVGGNVILRSTDGGVTWAQSAFRPAPTVSLWSVGCVSTRYCLAIGYQAQILPNASLDVTFVSTDGGLSWAEEPNSDALPHSMSCASTTVCIGNSFYGLVRTNDGGSTWSPVTTPVLGESLGGGVSCDAAGDCLIGSTFELRDGYETDVALSTDGGATWTTATAPDGIQQFDCVSGLACYELAFPLSSTPPSMLYVTSDGGQQNWTQLRVPKTSVPPTLLAFQCSAAACDAIAAADTAKVVYGPTSLWTAPVGTAGLTWTQDRLPIGIHDLGSLTLSASGATIVLAANAQGGPVILSDG